MAEIFEGPDSLRAYLTGATAEGLAQYDHNASLGGGRSSARLSCLTAQRLTAFPGIKLQYVDGANGAGLGRLLAVGPSQLKWAAPGEAYGAAVSIASGETKVLKSATASKFIVIARTTVLNLSGVENIQLSYTLHNALGVSNFTVAETAAGEAKYRGFIWKNHATGNATNVKAWIDADSDPRIEVAEATVTDGAIELLSDEYDTPTGLSWSQPSSGSPLTIGTLTPGEMFGLFVKPYVDADDDANPRVTRIIVVEFTVAGETFQQKYSGAGQIANADAEGFSYWWGEGAVPDYEGTPADEFFNVTAVFTDNGPVPSTEIELVQELTAGKWYVAERYTNIYGIMGPAKVETFEIADDLSEAVPRPSAPALVQVSQWGAGGYRVDAQYIPDWDDVGYRATHWHVYVTMDGTDPDPETDTPYEEAMQYDVLAPFVGQIPLAYIVSTEELEDTPIKVLVRTFREENVDAEIAEAESDNTTIYSTTLEYCGPQRPKGEVIYRNGLGIYTPPAPGPDGTPVVIDVVNDIYLEMFPGSTRLWYDDGTPHLISNWSDKGWYTPLQHDGTDIDTTGNADAIEVLSWTGGDKRLGFNVAGQRVCVFDITNNRIQSNAVFAGDTPSTSCQAVPVWQKYAHLTVNKWNAEAQAYESAASLDANGNWVCSVGFFPLTPEADCL